MYRNMVLGLALSLACAAPLHARPCAAPILPRHHAVGAQRLAAIPKPALGDANLSLRDALQREFACQAAEAEPVPPRNKQEAIAQAATLARIQAGTLPENYQTQLDWYFVHMLAHPGSRQLTYLPPGSGSAMCGTLVSKNGLGVQSTPQPFLAYFSEAGVLEAVHVAGLEGGTTESPWVALQGLCAQAWERWKTSTVSVQERSTQ